MGAAKMERLQLRFFLFFRFLPALTLSSLKRKKEVYLFHFQGIGFPESFPPKQKGNANLTGK